MIRLTGGLMGGVTISALCEALPEDLRIVCPDVAPEVAISAVHVSELPDPTPYLDGGELLLSTGMSLPRTTRGCRDYVHRLIDGRVSALALGVGPVHTTVPVRLVEACREAGMCLLEVPEPTPFLTISRAFWAAVSDADQRALSAALTAHRDLVKAAIEPEPVVGVLRALSAAVSGWAAQLDLRGDLVAAWPPDREQKARLLRAEVERLRMAGLRAAATFPLDGDDVVVHPLASADRVAGYLATGAPSPMSGADRHVVLTASALLSLDAVRNLPHSAAATASRAAIAQLFDLGMVDAARQLANRLHVPMPGGPVRVLVMDGGPGDAALDAVRGIRADRQIFGVAEGESAWCVLPDDDLVGEAELRAVFSGAGDQTRVLLGPPVELGQVATQRVHLVGDLRRRTPPFVGEVKASTERGFDGMASAAAEAVLHPLLKQGRPEVVDAVAAYLRQRGQWEAAARELGVHRNTLRYRIGTAEALLGTELRDPDTAATTWLALRALGLA